MSISSFLWVEKYRPLTMKDCILPSFRADMFNAIIQGGKVPNLLLNGGPGTGKTTVAKALCADLGAEVYFVNGSLNGNIDTLRNDIQQFASSSSAIGGQKVVLIDEADYLNVQSTQPALRGFIEEFSSVAFILTCNYKSKIIPPLLSRLSVIDFDIPREEKKEVFLKYLKRLVYILKSEGVEFDSADVLVGWLKAYLPDFRKLLGTLQSQTATTKRLTVFIGKEADIDINELTKLLQGMDYNSIRQWVVNNLNGDAQALHRKIYDELVFGSSGVDRKSLITALAMYNYQSCFVPDQEINTMGLLMEIMDLI